MLIRGLAQFVKQATKPTKLSSAGVGAIRGPKFMKKGGVGGRLKPLGPQSYMDQRPDPDLTARRGLMRDTAKSVAGYSPADRQKVAAQWGPDATPNRGLSGPPPTIGGSKKPTTGRKAGPQVKVDAETKKVLGERAKLEKQLKDANDKLRDPKNKKYEAELRARRDRLERQLDTGPKIGGRR